MARVIIDESLKDKNKALVLEAFEALFNRRDYAAAERFWSPDYIQHSAHIEPGRDGLFNLVKRLPPTLKYEPGTLVADGELIIVHGRFSGFQAVSWIAADILRFKEGLSCRALGCNPGRGHPGNVKEWSAHVRRRISKTGLKV
jgi:predicted SnoaL-like aldol condensation-catalyzing enzyme